MIDQKITPGVLISSLRENQTNRKTLKAQFSNQLFSKMTYEELEGLHRSIAREQKKRAKGKINSEIEFLKNHGYKVSGNG